MLNRPLRRPVVRPYSMVTCDNGGLIQAPEHQALEARVAAVAYWTGLTRNMRRLIQPTTGRSEAKSCTSTFA